MNFSPKDDRVHQQAKRENQISEAVEQQLHDVDPSRPMRFSTDDDDDDVAPFILENRPQAVQQPPQQPGKKQYYWY